MVNFCSKFLRFSERWFRSVVLLRYLSEDIARISGRRCISRLLYQVVMAHSVIVQGSLLFNGLLRGLCSKLTMQFQALIVYGWVTVLGIWIWIGLYSPVSKRIWQ